MAMSMKFTVNASGGGKPFKNTVTVNGSVQTMVEVDLTAKAGTLTGRTDNDTGVATMAAGHGIQSANVVDVYWAAGQRLGMTATVSGNSVTLDGGSGANLPATSTALTVMVQVVKAFAFDSEDLLGFVVQSEVKGNVKFLNDSDEVVKAYQFGADGGQDDWFNGASDPIPFDEPVTKVVITHGSIKEAAVRATVLV